jgi:hypothetical protein
MSVQASTSYFALAALAGSLRIMRSLVGCWGFLTGMLSGLVALVAPEAAVGGLTIGEAGCASCD